MSKDATFDSANQPINQQGVRRLYNKQDAPQDFVALRRRKTTKSKNIFATDKKRGRPRLNKRKSVTKTKNGRVFNGKNTKNTELLYLTNAGKAQKPVKTYAHANKFSECNDCQSNCCDKYPMRRIENIVFITCIVLASVVTLFVQDHNFLSDLKKKIAFIHMSEMYQKKPQSNEIITNTNQNSDSRPLNEQTEKASDAKELHSESQSDNKISINYQDLYIAQQLQQPLLITIICSPETETQKQENNILITMCEPSCCDCPSDSYAGSVVELLISDSIIVQGDLILSVSACGGGYIPRILDQSTNVDGKPLYTSPIDWGTPPLQSRYNFSHSSISITESYNNNWSQTCVPPAPHNLSVFLLAGIMNSFFRTRNLI